MKLKSSKLRARRVGALATAGCMLLQSVGPVYAGISQMPGLFVAPPDPNIMLTLDDSGSMEREALPQDNDGNIGTNMWNEPWASSNAGNSFKITSKKWRYFRSAVGNPIYYDPGVLYKPWPFAGNDQTNYGAANAASACYEFSVLPLPATAVALTCGNARNLADRVPTNGTDDGTEDRGYWPATYFTYNGGSGALTADGTSNQTANNNQADWTKVEIKPGVLTYPKSLARTDCTGAVGPTGCAYAQEIQNFANWFQYYRTRSLMAKGAVAQAFARQGTNLRVGIAALHGADSVIDGYTTPLIKRGVRSFKTADRTAFYTSLYATGANGYTPLRSAADVIGKYFNGIDPTRRVPGNPWSEDPSNLASVGTEHSCRRSFHILTSDGYWNTQHESLTGALTAVGNADDFTGYTAPAWPAGKPGTPDPVFSNSNTSGFTIDPFKDDYSNTLSDFTAYYWKNDLRPDLKNDVVRNSRDPAYWQHLTTFTVGIGVSNGNPNITTETQRNALVATRTAVSWAEAKGDGETTVKGDDFVHASMSGRGRFFLALNPTGLATSLAAALAEATDNPGSFASIATEAQQVSTATEVYQATYNPYGWTGRLFAFSQDASGTVNSTPTDINYTNPTQLWEASNKMPTPANRKIYTWNPISSVGSTFTAAGLTAPQLAALDNDTTLIDYLRGSDAKEVANGGTFRDRVRYTVAGVKGGVLGDIVNGSPIKGPSAGGGFDKLPPDPLNQASSYVTYRAAGNTALDNMRNTLFVGANDGMLHAFDRNSGVERFAYVPNSVFSVRPPSTPGPAAEAKLKMLADPSYMHRFTVDGPPQIGDAFIGPDAAGSSWKTVLVSSTGAGARSVFAMDVSNPKDVGDTTVPAGAFDTSKLMWEFSEANNADMGHVISYPHIARMRDGTWVAIFGNGYDSTNGQAKLFILDLRTGAVVWEQSVGTAGGNGLSQPNFTVNNNREVTAIYAGDLRGNLWKFDVNNPVRANWNVAFSGAPMYSPALADIGKQPITVMPELTPHPNGGWMVSFGTGKLFDVEDGATTGNVNLNTQAIYGMWDKPAETTGFTGISSLVEQTMNGALGAAVDTTLTGSTTNTVDWATKRGWYLNLNSGGERVNVNPQQQSITLLVVANKPDLVASADSDPCRSGGTSRLFALDPITGGAPDFGVFNADGAGGITSADKGYNVKSISYAVLSLPVLQSKKPFNDAVTLEKVGTRGQTGDRLGGVDSRPPSVNDCEKWLLAGASNTSIAGFDIALCMPKKPRISWRQLK